jgi:hypothetical protein
MEDVPPLLYALIPPVRTTAYRFMPAAPRNRVCSQREEGSMQPDRQAACDLATKLLGLDKLRMLGRGEFFWIPDHGVHTHVSWNLATAMNKLRSMSESAGAPEPH